MQLSSRPPVKFDSPPVVEVACGVSFTLVVPIKTAHVGLYWSQILSEFPRCDDAPPIALIVENPASPDSADYNIQVQQVSLPPLRRVWLINEPGTHLLQLQDDRFIFNWKRTDKAAEYPSYESVIADFRKQWQNYRQFLIDQLLGDPSVTQLELTYFSFIDGPQIHLRDHQRDERLDGRFLPPPSAVNLRTIYSLPGGIGRLHIAATSARHAVTGKKGIRLEITARGVPQETSDSDLEGWFDVAHEWITQGFADATTEEAHKIWGRTA